MIIKQSILGHINGAKAHLVCTGLLERQYKAAIGCLVLMKTYYCLPSLGIITYLHYRLTVIAGKKDVRHKGFASRFQDYTAIFHSVLN